MGEGHFACFSQWVVLGNLPRVPIYFPYGSHFPCYLPVSQVDSKFSCRAAFCLVPTVTVTWHIKVISQLCIDKRIKSTYINDKSNKEGLWENYGGNLIPLPPNFSK